MPAPFNHPSGLADAYDRTPDNPNWKRVIAREAEFAQGAEINEIQAIAENRGKRVGDMTASSGDRIKGGDILVDPLTGTVVLAAGEIYIKGDVRPVVARTLNSVAMTGTVIIGVRLVKTVTTEIEDPTLLGLAPGTEGEGEPGAGRESEVITWSLSTLVEAGDFYSVYLLKDGVVVDQTPPPNLSGVTAVVASYDRDAHGSYVVEGCRVTALGKVGTEQVFSIAEGVANIFGFKRSREAALIHREVEEWDEENIVAEVHTFADSGTGTAVIPLNHTPLSELISAVITKEVIESVTKGTANSADALLNSSVSSLQLVKQGGTTYVAGTSYLLTNDTVDWSPGGAEPATSSSYDVTYRYLDAVTPDSVTDTTVTLSGGVTGTTVILTYERKMPRIDLLCIDRFGLPAYVRGISARLNPQPPIAPFDLLPLATIDNGFMDTPLVKNIGVRSYHFTKIHRMYERLIDALDLIALERLKSDIDQREPVAKKGVFVDPLEDDNYRDAGEPQTAAVFQGSMQLPITPTFFYPVLAAPAMLNFTEEVIIDQPLITGQIKINPYNSYDLIPASLHLEPPVDFWVDQPVTALDESFVTQQVTQTVMHRAVGRNAGTDVVVTEREQRSVDETIQSDAVFLSLFMRQIDVDFTINGFGNGEVLETLLFGGVDVMPAGTPTADGNGQIVDTFTIPANIPTGRVLVYAEGAGGSRAQALFVSNGYYDLETIQRVTTISRTIIRDVTVTTAPIVQGGGGRPQGQGNGRDPVSQSFTLTEGRHIAGVNVKFAAFGVKTKGILVELLKTEHGLPSGEVLAQGYMANLTPYAVGAWVPVRFAIPLYVPPDIEHCFIVRTDDDDHALALAAIGGFDPVTQSFVGAQPYSIGLLASSSNSNAWTAHQTEDLTFQIIAALFSPTTKTVNFGTFVVAQASDLSVRAGVFLPTAECDLQFEIERADTTKTRLRPNQNWEMDEYVSETITLRAFLTGTSKVSPVLYPGLILVAGELEASATYVSRAMLMGTGVRLSTFQKLLLPSGSGVTVQFDKTDDVWLNADVEATTILDLGWIEREFRYDTITAVQGRMKITITGAPDARPSIQDLRAVSI